MASKTYEDLSRVNYDCLVFNVVTKNTENYEFFQYQAPLARLHQLYLHDSGVASGLEVSIAPGAKSLLINPGVAIDRTGQLIVLSTSGQALLGAPAVVGPPAKPSFSNPVSVPVSLPTSGLASGKYLLTIQYEELPDTSVTSSQPDLVCGAYDVTPWLRLQSVSGFTDDPSLVCLGVVVLGTGGAITSLNAIDTTAPLSRRRLGETVGALTLETTIDNNPTGTVQQVVAGSITALPAGNGLQFTGNLAIGQSVAARPLDVVGSAAIVGVAAGPELVLLSSTQGGGGGVATFDANGKRMAAFTTSGTGTTQAGYVSVGTAAGTEIVSLSASGTGAGQVQVQTHTGSPAVILNTAGANDDGFVHVLSNGQDAVTLGPSGIATKGTITSSGTITAPSIAVQGNLTAQSITSSGAITAPSITVQGNITTQSITASGTVTCSSVSGQGWSTSSSGVSGNGWALSGSFVSGSGWGLSGGSVAGINWNIDSSQITGSGWFLNSGGAQGSGWNVGAGGFTTSGGISAQGQISTPAAGFFTGGVVANAGLWTSGQVNANDWVHTNSGYNVNLPGFTAAFMSGNGDGGYLGLQNKSSKEVVQLWTGSNGVGAIIVTDANGNEVHRLDGAGPKNFVMAHPRDGSKDIVYACIEGPEAAAYIRGRATLTSGRAQVQLPEHFALVVNPDTMTVQLTPRSAASKGLAVVESGAGAFAVQELFAGTGTYDFDYFVAGVRKGFEHYQPVVAKGFSAMGHRVTSGYRATTPGSVSSAPTPAADAHPAAPLRATPPDPSNKPKPWDVI